MYLTYCTPCQYGDHKNHFEVVQSVPKGMYGGARCRCKGECKDDKRTIEDIWGIFYSDGPEEDGPED
jgi:hypothetical protein